MRLAALPAARRSRVLRLLPAATVLLAALLPGATPAAAPTSPAAGDQGAVASYYRPEVRLRKLHLVRPDLIPYPLSYDVYC